MRARDCPVDRWDGENSRKSARVGDRGSENGDFDLDSGSEGSNEEGWLERSEEDEEEVTAILKMTE